MTTKTLKTINSFVGALQEAKQKFPKNTPTFIVGAVFDNLDIQPLFKDVSIGNDDDKDYTIFTAQQIQKEVQEITKKNKTKVSFYYLMIDQKASDGRILSSKKINKDTSELIIVINPTSQNRLSKKQHALAPVVLPYTEINEDTVIFTEQVTDKKLLEQYTMLAPVEIFFNTLSKTTMKNKKTVKKTVKK